MLTTIRNKRTTLGIMRLAACIGISLFIGSCQKPNYTIQDADSYTKVFLQSASNGTLTKSLAITDSWSTTLIGAGYGGVTANERSIQVQLEVDPAKIAQYNELNHTSYELPPAESFTFEDALVDIKPGMSGSSSARLNINPLKLGGTKTYLLPISITQVNPAIPVAEGLQTTFILVNGYFENNPYTPLSKGDWEILEVSSDNNDGGVGGRAHFSIDDNLSTCWLSQYSRVNNVRPVHPHHISIDMNKVEVLHGVQLYGRQTLPGASSQAYLFPKNVRVEVSDDGENWSQAGLFTLAPKVSTEPEDTLYFEEEVSCRYFKITVLSSTSANGDTTGLAEIVAF